MGKFSVGYLKDTCATFIAILLFSFAYGLNEINTLKPFVLFGLACMIFVDGIFTIYPSYHNTIIGQNIPTYVVLSISVIFIIIFLYVLVQYWKHDYQLPPRLFTSLS